MRVPRPAARIATATIAISVCLLRGVYRACGDWEYCDRDIQRRLYKALNWREIESYVPKKIRELKRLLLQAGFDYQPGKGSHTKWFHPLLPGKLTLSGRDSADAKRYQEDDVDNALSRLAEIKGEQEGHE
ncbi:type II toxin-antitoxin system HicA family toxin [Phormidesmis sp. 146-12]